MHMHCVDICVFMLNLSGTKFTELQGYPPLPHSHPSEESNQFKFALARLPGL